MKQLMTKTKSRFSHIFFLLLIIFANCETEPDQALKEDEEDPEVFPSGKITSPIAGKIGRVTKVTVAATDDKGVVKVEIFINDVLRLTDSDEPYEYEWNTFKDGEAEHEVKAIITNQDGNSISDSLIVSVEITNILIPSDFSDLSDSMMKPYLNEGDTVSVSAGNYPSINLNFTNYPNLHFVGIDGAENVVLDANGEGRVIAISESVIEGFTIQNGLAEDNGGGGILLYGSTIRNCIIRNNKTTRVSYDRGGGGIQLIYTGVVENNLIYQNSCEYVGGGLHIAEKANATVLNNVFVGNSVNSGWGGGIYIHMGNATILNNILYDNDCPDNDTHCGLRVHNNNEFGIANYNYGVPSDFGADNLQTNTGSPGFVASDSQNFRLDGDSQCIDAGHPASEYNDTDGSRNDMGAYGGPLGDWNK